MTRPTRVTVDDEAAAALRRGRPYVFREAIVGRPVADPGDFVELCDKKGAFLGRGLADPESALSVRVLTRDEGALDLDALVHARLAAAMRLRERFLDLAATEAYRLCNGEGDGLSGLAIERYGAFGVVELTTPAWEPHRGLVVAALRAALASPAESPPSRAATLAGIVEKSRLRPGRSGEVVRHLFGEEPPETLWVREGPARFCVELRGTGKSGLFIDQRETRATLAGGRITRGGAVLNAFSYTGSLSCAAGLGQATQVTSLDLSRPALMRARRNYEGNGLDPAQHEVIEGDAFQELPALVKKGRRFDTVILDPPAFATTKKRVFQAERHYADLVALAARLLREGGVLVASTPMAALPLRDFEEALAKGASEAKATLRVFDSRSQPADHPVDPGCPEKRYLKILFAVRE